jgi:hypothetical protein
MHRGAVEQSRINREVSQAICQQAQESRARAAALSQVVRSSVAEYRLANRGSAAGPRL